MMMIPRKRNDFDLWDDVFKDPFFDRTTPEKVMKTDVKEKDNEYVIDVDLPGYEKENIQLEIDNGYLNIHATANSKNDEDDGKFVRKERFFGECSRSFYIGDEIKEEDIKASFKNGTLRIQIPKKNEDEQIPEKKYIQIED